MKKICVAVLISIICLCSVVYIEHNIYKIVSIKKQSENLLENAYYIVEQQKEQNVNSVGISNDVDIHNGDVIGLILIPKINIEAPIREGTSQKVMENSVGHFVESDYWDGNVSLASHNSGTSAHYFEKINTLEINDEIIYKTVNGTKKYRVQHINKIKSTDWSMINKKSNNENNTITLITCINRQPNYRLCVRGIEV
nr:class D sortase [Clostridia bacterium]